MVYYISNGLANFDIQIKVTDAIVAERKYNHSLVNAKQLTEMFYRYSSAHLLFHLILQIRLRLGFRLKSGSLI